MKKGKCKPKKITTDQNPETPTKEVKLKTLSQNNTDDYRHQTSQK